jgi:hypothetical protein
VTIGVPQVEVLPAKPGVDLQVGLAVRAAAVLDPRPLETTEDRIELGGTDVKADVVVLKLFSIGKIQGQDLVDVHGSEHTRPRFLPGDAKKLGQGFAAALRLRLGTMMWSSRIPNASRSWDHGDQV